MDDKRYDQAMDSLRCAEKLLKFHPDCIAFKGGIQPYFDVLNPLHDTIAYGYTNEAKIETLSTMLADTISNFREAEFVPSRMFVKEITSFLFLTAAEIVDELQETSCTE